jgi:microcystin-dependent protein
MASSWSELKIQLMATGENTTVWGNVTNLNWTNVQSMICGTDSVTFANANETITLSNTTGVQTARFARLQLGGNTGGSTRDLVVPTVEKTYIIYNSCADTIRVKTTAGTGVNVPAGKSTTLVVDGTNVVAADDYFPSVTTTNLTATNVTFTAPLPVASGGTGSNTALGALASVFPVGVILDYGGSAAPSGWLLAAGQNVSRATYSALFAVFSTTYGAGDGSTTFALPDYRGRVGAGKDDMGGTSAGRLSSVMTSTTLGNVGGAQQITLTAAQLAAHTHSFSGTTVSDGAHVHAVSDPTHSHGVSDPGHSHTFGASGTSGSGVNGRASAPSYSATTDSAGTGISISGAATGISIVSGGSHTHTFSGTTGSNGSASSVNIVQPTIIVNKIIFAGV